MYSSKVPSLYTRNSYMESHQAGYMMNPAYTYDEISYASSRPPSQYSHPASHNPDVYYTIQDDRNHQLTFKSSNQRKRTIALICVLLLVLVIIAVGVALGVILSKDKDDDKPSEQKVQSSFQGEGILLDKTWSVDYLDRSSQLYMTAEQEFKDKVKNQLSQSSLGQYYQDVTVLGFREGSVIIEFILRFLVPVVEATIINTNSILNEMILIPDVTSVSIAVISSTTSSTSSSSITSPITTVLTTTTKVPTTTTTTTQSTTTTTPTAITVTQTFITASTTKAPTTTTKSPTTTTTTKAATTQTTTRASTTPPTTKAPSTNTQTSSPTTQSTTKTSTTQSTTKAPTTSTTTSSPTTQSTTKTSTTLSTTKAPTTSTTTPSSTTKSTTTTPGTTTTTQTPTTTLSIIPVCSEGYSLYTILIEYLRTYDPVVLDIQSQPSKDLKTYLENWGATLIYGFGAQDSVPQFKISDFGPPITNSSYTLVTIRVCIASSANVDQIISLLGAYIGFLPEFNNVGLSDVFDVIFEYNYQYESTMSNVTSSAFSSVANTLQSKANGIITTYNLQPSIPAFYVTQLEPMESNNNTKAIMRMAAVYKSVTLTLLDYYMGLATDLDSEISLISIEQS